MSASKLFTMHLLVAVVFAATSVAARQANGELLPRATNDTKAANNDKKQPKVVINQMDLLSGGPAGIALIIGVMQIWPSPTQVCRRHLQDFLVWLKSSVEKDFCMTLYSCEGKCFSRDYEPTIGNVDNRIKANAGAINCTQCVGSGNIKVEELVDIIQRGDNGITLDELARVVRYPRMKNLGRAIKILRFCPLFGKRVVFFQWIVVFFMYLFNWVFHSGLPQLVLRFLRFSFNVLRRPLGFPPIDYTVFRGFGLEYRISELASSKVLTEQLPWAKYSVYNMLVQLAGRKLATKVWGVDDRKAGNTESNQDLGKIENEDNAAFNHPMLEHRRLVRQMTTDECSAAEMLYMIGLHSMRLLLLCRGIGFPPPYMIAGSFSNASIKLDENVLVFKHKRLENLFKMVYSYERFGSGEKIIGADTKDYMHLSYDLLAKKMQSELGDLITHQLTSHVLLSLTLASIKIKYISKVMAKSKGTIDERLRVDGIELDEKQEDMLARGQVETCRRVLSILGRLATPSLYWGATVWLLYSLYQVSKGICRFNDKFLAGSGNSEGMPDNIDKLIKLLINSPFQMIVYDDICKNNFDKHQINQNQKSSSLTSKKLGSIVALNEDIYWNSAPAWCACSTLSNNDYRKQCRGICTLIINETLTFINMSDYFRTPYFFQLRTQAEPEKKNSSDSSTPTNNADASGGNITGNDADASNQNSASQIALEPAENSDFVRKTVSRLPNIKLKEEEETNMSPGPLVHDVARLVCLSDRHQLMKNNDQFQIERIALVSIKKPEPTASKKQVAKKTQLSANANITDTSAAAAGTQPQPQPQPRQQSSAAPQEKLAVNPDPLTVEKLVELARYCWSWIRNIRHLKSHPNLRIDMTPYPLSTLLFENKPQLVAILGDTMYVVSKKEALAENAKWPFMPQTQNLTDWFKGNDSVCTTIAPVVPLLLGPSDKFADRVTKGLGMGAGRLQYERRTMRKEIYRLDAPVRSISVDQ